MTYHSNMTSKGQVTVPKDIRDALGLLPGQRVRFAIDEQGNARILRADDRADAEQRKAEFRQRLAEVQSRLGGKARFMDKDGLDYQRWIRPDRIDI